MTAHLPDGSVWFGQSVGVILRHPVSAPEGPSGRIEAQGTPPRILYSCAATSCIIAFARDAGRLDSCLLLLLLLLCGGAGGGVVGGVVCFCCVCVMMMMMMMNFTRRQQGGPTIPIKIIVIILQKQSRRESQSGDKPKSQTIDL
eukprot:gnl/Spiro4/5557_TR2822_c0_g1_i1.p1 gnl/Spiro4/5557_TR2822_c0_g1~~gnl/Spiro4/5557_TR2822_c0_g1_i1.p1  ORF type:complete len:144 (+),score=29.83 gnl/Spiro4/5557_TR2822_c0_g1_i1:97-528(+)